MNMSFFNAKRKEHKGKYASRKTRKMMSRLKSVEYFLLLLVTLYKLVIVLIAGLSLVK